MDNVTHALIGMTVNSLLKEKNRTTFWVSLVASEVPDIDILYRLKGSLDYLLNHRGFSHSLPGLLLAALVITIVAGRMDPTDKKKIFLLAFFCLGLHVTFDIFTSWGTQLFYPFWQKWFYLDFVPIVDPVIIIIALAFLAANHFTAHRHRLIPLAGTLLIVLFLLGRLTFHGYLTDKYQSLYPGARVSVLASYSPLDWKVIVEEREYLLSGRTTLGKFGQTALQATPVNPRDTEKYMSNEYFSTVVKFFRYPLYTLKDYDQGKVLVVNDFYYAMRQVEFPLDGNENIEGNPQRANKRQQK